MMHILKIIKTLTIRRLCFIITGAIIAILIIILYIYVYERNTTKNKNNYSSKQNDLSCHYLKDEGALKALDDKLVKFSPNAIFFIESSCEGLTSRQICSIESAARAHPGRQIVILFTSPMPWEIFKTNGLSIILGMSNTEAARIHLEDYSRGTPFYNVLSKKPLTRNDINMNVGDILKFVTMYKYGGTYLGLDVLVAHPFDDLNENWIVKETPVMMSADMFSFSNNKDGRSLVDIVTNIVLGDISLPNKQDLWTFQTYNALNEMAKIWCTTLEIRDLYTSKCKGLQINEPDGFIPINIYDRQKYFEQGEWTPLKNETIYTYRTFDHLTKHHIVPNPSLYDTLAKKYCPTVYKFYGAQFGLV